MKIYTEGEKSKAICPHCGLVETIFQKRDTPIDGVKTIVKNVLVGVCTKCDKIISIPQQSAPYAHEALQKEQKSLEVRIQRHFSDILASSAFKLKKEYSTSTINFLIRFFIHDISKNKESIKNIAKSYKHSLLSKTAAANERFSLKLDEELMDEFLEIKRLSKLKTNADVFKALVLQIENDILNEKNKKFIEKFNYFSSAIA